MYSLQALRLALGLQGSDFAPSGQTESDLALAGWLQYWVRRAVKWQGEGTLSAQEVTLKFQEWLLSRHISSLFEVSSGAVVELEEALSRAQLSAESVLKAIEKEYDGWLVTAPLLGYDVAGSAVVRQTVNWVSRAEAVFLDLDSENRRYLVSDSLTYFLLSLKKEAAFSPDLSLELLELLVQMKHWQGQVTSLGFKVYLLRYGYASMQAVTTLQVRIKRLARLWMVIKAQAMQIEEPIWGFCGHFALCKGPFPSIFEQSIQLALPATYPDFAGLQAFLRFSLPGAVLVDRQFEGNHEEVVAALASQYPGDLSQDLLLILTKAIHYYCRLSRLSIELLLDPASNLRTAKQSPIHPTTTLTPSYFRHTISSRLKHSRPSPPVGLLNSLLKEDAIPKVRLSLSDLRPAQAKQ